MPNNNDKKGGLAAGVGLAALAAAAGAYYFYGSKHSAQHRKNMKSWMVKAKAEVMEKMEKARELSKGTYDTIVDQVTDKYSKLKNVPADELATMAREMKGHWNRISAELNKPARKPAAKKLPARKSPAKQKK